MVGIFKRLKTTINEKLTKSRNKKSEKQQQLERQKRIEEQNRNAEDYKLKTNEFLSRVEETRKVVRNIYKGSTALRLMSNTLRDPKITQEGCKKVFFDAIRGIKLKYDLKFEFVDYGVVQKLKKDPGNYSTYLVEKKTILMEKLPRKDNPQKADYEHMLRELRHEYGYFLLLEKYGSIKNFPDTGIMKITKLLDDMHD